MSAIRIARREVSLQAPPLIIAELSGNHNGSLERALRIVDAVADAGAHALKLQTFTADTMTLDIDRGEFRITDPDMLWAGRTLYSLFDEAHTPWEWHAPIFARARERGLIAFSSPFDRSAVDFLESLGVPCYKIASAENIDLPLISYVASKGKPIILSTGLATREELQEAVDCARSNGCTELLLLKCTAAYPAPYSEVNLRTIPDLRTAFGSEVGLSDHSLGLAVPIAAVAYGASAIEKHVTLARADGGVDSAFSLEPDELAQLVREVRHAWLAGGTVSLAATDSEQSELRYRRSLYVAVDIRAGETFTDANVRSIRPGLGLAPKHLNAVLGRRAAADISRGTALSWDLVAGGNPSDLEA